MSYLFEQQPNESNKAFAAFSTYLAMGPERSVAAVGKELGKSEGLIERWSSKFDWPARVQAHGAHLAGVEREMTEVMARTKAGEWAKRREKLLETEWEMHEKCIAAAKRAFDAFLAREKVYANLADIARILEIASKLGRLASGMATDKTEVSGEVDVNFRMEIEAAIKKVYAEPELVIDVETVPNLAPREIGGGK
jgi:hypothetical protein